MTTSAKQTHTLGRTQAGLVCRKKVEKKPFSLYHSICTCCISVWNLNQCTEGHASSEMRTTKLKSTFTTVAICPFQCERGIGWAQKITNRCFQTTRRMHYSTLYEFWPSRPPNSSPKKRFWQTWACNFHWKVVCPCPGSMEHDSKTCRLACGWAYGCTIALVAAIIIVKAKQHSNPFVLDTVETTPTATSFCAISIQAFLPRLCPRRSGMWSRLRLITIFCLRSVSARANTAAGGSLAPRFLDHLHLGFKWPHLWWLGVGGWDDNVRRTCTHTTHLIWMGWMGWVGWMGGMIADSKAGGQGWIVVCGLLALCFMLLLSVLLLVAVAVAAVAAAAAFGGASGNGVSASSAAAAACGGAFGRAAGNGVVLELQNGAVVGDAAVAVVADAAAAVAAATGTRESHAWVMPNPFPQWHRRIQEVT